MKTMPNKQKPYRGEHSVAWDGKDDRNNPVSSGIYFYRLTTADFATQKKMILITINTEDMNECG
jgi:flagellar hook assembly protein FlgD